MSNLIVSFFCLSKSVNGFKFYIKNFNPLDIFYSNILLYKFNFKYVTIFLIYIIAYQKL